MTCDSTLGSTTSYDAVFSTILFVLAAEDILQPGDVVLAEVVILIQDADLRVGFSSTGSGVDLGLGAKLGCQPIVHGNCAGSAHLSAPLTMKAAGSSVVQVALNRRVGCVRRCRT